MSAAPAVAPTVEIRAQAGPQEAFLATPADIAIYGGQAGGGKSFALLLEPLRHIGNGKFGAVIFRRTSVQIRNEGGLWDESGDLYPYLGGVPREQFLDWTFPSGMSITFAHMEHEKDRHNWQGAQIALIGFDELTHFGAPQFWYMLSRNRSTCGVRPYIRATCNPDPDSFVADLISWWIDEETGYPIPERSGVIRWFVRVDGKLEWGSSREDVRSRFPNSEPKSLTFIPAKLEDNPALTSKDPGYRANLEALTLVERERLLGGNWKIRNTAGNMVRREWLEIVDGAPVDARRVRWWDKAATSDDGDYTVGTLLARAGGIYYVEDVVRGQWSPGEGDRVIRQTAELDRERYGGTVEQCQAQDPAQAGKRDAEAFVTMLDGHPVHTQTETGAKEVRSRPWRSQAEHGNLKLVRGRWNAAVIEELAALPDGGWDVADTLSGACGRLAGGTPLRGGIA